MTNLNHFLWTSSDSNRTLPGSTQLLKTLPEKHTMREKTKDNKIFFGLELKDCKRKQEIFDFFQLLIWNHLNLSKNGFLISERPIFSREKKKTLVCAIKMHADWFIAIVYKSTDNKNDVRCNTCTFLMENKAKSDCIFLCYCKKQIDGTFLWSILLLTIK